jgi:hypothetical protein
MGLRPATMHENGLRCLSPVFSIGASPIFTAARNLLLVAALGRAVSLCLGGKTVGFSAPSCAPASSNGPRAYSRLRMTQSDVRSVLQTERG